MADTRVEDIYSQVKSRVVGFDIRPGDRVNEVALARDLSVSRTPLREALNRLMAERLLEFRPGAGFFCRQLEPQAIYDLYELRAMIETHATRLACTRASDEELEVLREETFRHGLDVTGLTVAQAVGRDEDFHLAIARGSGNAELVAQLTRIHDRIRFIRWVNMAARVQASKREHKTILEALLLRQADQAADLMLGHISQRMDQVVSAVKEGISNIYMGEAEALPARMVQEV